MALDVRVERRQDCEAGLRAVRAADQPLSAAEVAATLGFSRPTAQRYLAELLRRDLVTLELAYGSTGRPEHRYRAPR